MAVWELIETVYNITVIMTYVSAGLWIIAAIVNMVRNFKNKRNKK